MSAEWKVFFHFRLDYWDVEKREGLTITGHPTHFNSQADAQVCADRLNAKDARDAMKPFGHEVTVMFHGGSTKTFHYVGSASKARYNGILKPLAKNIVSVTPITKEEWFRAYGDPSWRGL